MNGKLIVICGTDGSGKGTQTEILIKKLKDKGINVEMTDFPQYDKDSSFMIKEYLNGKFGSAKEVGPYKASIFYAVDRYHASFQMKKWLAEGKIIVSNRYVSANFGHQGGKIKDSEKRKNYIKWVQDLEYNIFQIPKPDLNIFLHVRPEISQKLVDKKAEREYTKGKKRDIHEADLNHLKDSESAYLEVCNNDDSWIKIECVKDNELLSIESIANKIDSVVDEFLNKQKTI